MSRSPRERGVSVAVNRGVLTLRIYNIRFDPIEQFLDHLSRPTLRELRGVEQAVRKGFANNFNSQGPQGRAWAALAPFTQRQRARQGFNPTSPILIRTGRYQRSFTRVGGYTELSYLANGGGWEFSVGSSDPRADALDYGARARNLPARPVRLLDFAAERGVAAALEVWVSDCIALFL